MLLISFARDQLKSKSPVIRHFFPIFGLCLNYYDKKEPANCFHFDCNGNGNVGWIRGS